MYIIKHGVMASVWGFGSNRNDFHMEVYFINRTDQHHVIVYQ